MADSLSLIYRGTAIEDLLQASTLGQVNLPVLNVGPSVPVTPILAANGNAAALAAGATQGSVYINNGEIPNQLTAAYGAYQSWSPLPSTSGGMTVATYEVVTAEYCINGPNCFISLQFQIQFTNTAQATFYITQLPESLVGLSFSPINCLYDATIESPTLVTSLVQGSQIYFQNNGNFTLGLNYTFFINGYYRIV